MSGRQRYQGLLLLLVAGALLWWVLVDGALQAEPQRTSDPSAQATDPAAEPTGGTDPASGLPTVLVDDLPSEAARILDLIDRGGPFDEDEDGGTFENREEILPDEQLGYYQEFTVPTPGSDERGARRIVAGEDGELYWTDDHYRSFSRIRR